MAFVGITFTFCHLGGDFHSAYCLVQENKCGFDRGQLLDVKLRTYIIARVKLVISLKYCSFLLERTTLNLQTLL